MTIETNEKKSAPVFIAGRPRSGTTLLNSVLDSLPGIALHPQEQKFFTYWGHMYRGRDLNDDAVFEEFLRDYTSHPNFEGRLISPEALRARLAQRKPRRISHVLEAVCANYADSTGKARWGEKTPNHYRHLDEIRAAFPDAQIILTMRDPRALLASILKRDFGLRDPHDQALAWVEYCDLIEKWSRDPGVFIIQYEKLVTQPTETLKSVCDFLGEPFDEAIIGKRTLRSSGRPKMEGGNARAASGIDSSSLEKWKSDLTPRQIRIVEHFSGPALDRWGYERSTGGLTLADKAYITVRYGMRPAMNALRGIKRRLTGNRSEVIPG